MHVLLKIIKAHRYSSLCRPLPPNILWGQRTNTILLTVELSDIRDETFSLEEKVFRFSGVGGDEGKRYDVEITFYKEVVTKVRM